MKKLALALVAFSIAAPSVAPAQDLAPAVKRKPAATTATTPAPAPATPPAPVAPAQNAAPPEVPALARQPLATSAPPAAPQPRPAATATPAAAQPASRFGSERDAQAALTAAAGGGSDAALDTSLIRVMSRLVASGRCGEAAGLAARGGRKELASRAQQLCK